MAHATAAKPSDAQPQQTFDDAHTTSIANQREGQDPVGTSLPVPDTSKSLAGFLADYVSGSDSNSDT